MILQPTTDAFMRAADALRRGEVVAHPTETVYGLAVDPFSAEALARLFAVKGRPEANPVLVIVSSMTQLEGLVAEMPAAAMALAARFWPGPLSLVLPRAPGVPDALTAGSANVCVRCTANAVARGICDAFGGGITSTSANLSGETPAMTVRDAVLPGVAFGMDGGELMPSRASTIYDPMARRVLREGPITLGEILDALG